MSKLKNNRSGIFNLDPSEVNEVDNVRKEYKNIDSLADSIMKYGQEQACGVDRDNNIIWGHRRLRAVMLLVSQGESTQLRCVQAQGDRKCMQMIENLHRDDLTAEEKENGVADMVEELGSQKEVSITLCLPSQKVSDIMNAHKLRMKAFDIGEDTSELSTSAVNIFRTVDEKDLPEVIQETKKKGGTVKAAKRAVEEVVKPEKSETPQKDIIAEAFYITVKCLRECINNTGSYCTSKNIEIDDAGYCLSFEEPL